MVEAAFHDVCEVLAKIQVGPVSPVRGGLQQPSDSGSQDLLLVLNSDQRMFDLRAELSAALRGWASTQTITTPAGTWVACWRSFHRSLVVLLLLLLVTRIPS